MPCRRHAALMRVIQSAPEFALLLPAVAVGVAHAALDRFLGRLVELAAATASPLRGLHDLLLPGVVRRPVLYATSSILTY